MIESQKVPASHGLLWIKHGIRLIMRSPLQAVSLAMIFILGLVLVRQVPGGVMMFMLFMPVLMAGYMRVCRALEYSEAVSPRYIIAGFEKQTGQLVLVGGMLLLGMVVISMVTVLLGGDTLSAIMTEFQKSQDSRALVAALTAPDSGMLPSMLVGLLLFFVLTLILQYTPMLIFFEGLDFTSAAKLSMRGSLQNIIPLTVYSMLMQLFAFLLSALPFNLGVLVLLPVGLTSMYVSYRDIFSETQNPENAAVSE